ncbi:baseplate J/gp47 family protein [Delftia acidovorans]|uniref:Baseplate J/gp47 family protein n=1 Tax=Delftia acidovorans TaxID=80866 RepID=A0A7T2W1D6_DELAC|nr:baseplate J/gp47 family protein [Delftia acidovorans]QPS10287.1 baseplate J/gp47 family protein [Delftia acidovorans]
MTTTDLATLPPPVVVEPLDFEALVRDIKADVLARYPEAAEVLALESEPMVKLLEAFAFREMLYRARVNDAARAHLLAFATGGDLDHLGALPGVVRLAGEDDERLRLRIQLRIAALAGQGTREHYEFVALTASLNVRGAHAMQPAPGSVHVVLWLYDAGQDTVQQVRSALDDEAARMLGVVVSVGLAKPRPINVRARIWRTAGASPALLTDLAALLAANLGTQAALGRRVARSWITSILHAPGVAEVGYMADDAPAATTVLAADEYPVPGVVELIDAGVQ